MEGTAHKHIVVAIGDCSSVNTRVRCRLPSPRMRATAILVLSYRIDGGTPPKNANARIWPSQKASVVITGHKTGVRVRKVKSEEVDLALDATDNSDGFTKVYLSMSRTMLQRHEHLLSPPMPAGHIILHNRDAACETVFVPKPLETPLRGMLLLLRTRLVVQENAIDHENKWIKLRPSWRLLAHVTRRYRKLHHLGDCPRINPKLSCRLAMA